MSHLEGFKVHVEWTNSFHQAAQEIENGAYDLFMLSFENGGMQLLNAARQYKDRTPALLLTRFEDPRSYQKAIEWGAIGGVALNSLNTTTTRENIQAAFRQADGIRVVTERDERLRLALKAAQMVAWDWNIPKDELRYSSEPSMVTGRNSYGLRHRFQTFLGYVHPEDRKAVNESIQSVLKHGTDYEFEYRIKSSEGTMRWVRSVAKVFRDINGDPLRMTGIVMDITEKREAAEALRRMNEELERRVQMRTAELEASNKELEAFAYSVSHDLRVPLQAIYGFVEIITTNPNADEASVRFTKRIRRSAERMSALIDDLLALSRVTRLKLNPEKTNLSQMFLDIWKDRKYHDAVRNIQVDIQENMWIRCDERMMKIAIENLFGNAWKYTGKKEEALIQIGSFEHNGQAIYYISDNGAGFDMEKAEKLFQPFHRLHTEREFTGTGVGLATVARVISRHGGSIAADAALGHGARFFFSLHDPLHDEVQVRQALRERITEGEPVLA